MVAEEFIKLVGDFKLTKYVGVEDFADKLNFLFSSVFIILSLMIVTVKSYFFKPLACYTSTTPGGSNFDSYVENYCWVHGTIMVAPGEKMPQTVDDWARYDVDHRINYYQWVPFILGLQCVMFHIPRIIWQLIVYNKVGTDLEALVTSANSASHNPPSERAGVVEKISRQIEDMLFQHRDYRHGKIANIRRKAFKLCNLCVFSKHLGTWLISSYMLMKILYGINALGQLFLMKKFLGFHQSIQSFGYHVLNNIATGKEWDVTRMFPRVSYCYIDSVRHLGAKNQYVAQCALPINMLNEKIYIFLWFWILFVGITTIISIPLWFIRMAFLSQRSSFIHKMLLRKDSYILNEQRLMHRFISDFLRHDGVFLLRMLYINAGDLITSEIVCKLFEIYKDGYKEFDLKNYGNTSKPTNLNLGRNPNTMSSNDSIAKEPLTNFV